MKFHKLRIAWSVGWGLVCVLLVVLWAASYGQNHRSFRVANIGWRSDSGALTWYSPYALVDDGTHLNRYSRDDTLLLKPPPMTLEWSVSFVGVRFFGPGSVWTLIVPYWLAMLSSFVPAVVPWIRWPNRFNIRTLLIATTLVAVVLGLSVYAARK